MKQYNYIYKITNLTNGKIYIGKHSTDNLDDGYFGSGKIIKQSIQKYGIENFEKEIIAFCYTQDELNRQECFYIRDFNSMDSSVGYNLTKGGDGMLGLVKTEEHRKKISESHRGKHPSEETKIKMRKPHNMNYVRTEEHRSKLSESNKGKKHGPMSEECKNKISNTMKGRPAWNKGIPRSEESKRKASESLKGKTSWVKGKTMSEESNLKRSMTMKLYWEKRKKEAI